MIGQFAKIAKLLGNAGKIREDVERLQERLRAARFAGEAGGGKVRATCDGRVELVALRIAPELVEAGDVEMLEELVIAAVGDAARQAREGAKREMESMASELGFPGLSGLLDVP